MYVRTLPELGDSSNAWPGLGQPALPQITAFAFRNTGTVHAQNHCAICADPPATGGRRNLGVGLRGNGAVNLRAANGMELSFTISGHRPGIEYDILRTRRNSLWVRSAGAWTRIDAAPMGTWDDNFRVDEWLTPRNGRIFAIDMPGWPGIPMPAPDGTDFLGDPALNDTATDIVLRASFAEWVNARSKADGIGWTRLPLPPFQEGSARPHIYWHTITWLIRNPLGDPTGNWVVGPLSRIRLGPLSAAVIRSVPA